MEKEIDFERVEKRHKVILWILEIVVTILVSIPTAILTAL